MKIKNFHITFLFVSFLILILFSCQKGNEPIPYSDGLLNSTESVTDTQNRDGDGDDDFSKGDDDSSTDDDSDSTDGDVIGGDDNEDDDDTTDKFQSGDDDDGNGGDNGGKGKGATNGTH